MDKDRIYLEEIKEFCGKVIFFMEGVDFLGFFEDEKLQLAVIKLIENIGEASKRISPETQARYPSIDWKKAMAMRDKLVHNYMEIDPEIVYDVATTEIPSLLTAIKGS